MRPLQISLSALALLSLNACLWHGPKAPISDGGWHDDYVTRLKAQALLQNFNANLLSQPSATATLEEWCVAHRLAVTPKITAHLRRDVDKPVTPEQRQALQVDASEPVKYRRVQLACGDHVLSEADNWYVPSRLTAQMNHQLETTDTPFGAAVKALNFRRQTQAVQVLWQPLHEGWEMRAPDPKVVAERLPIPAQVLQHRATLYRQDNTPFSLVVETYTAQVFAFDLTPADARSP